MCFCLITRILAQVAEIDGIRGRINGDRLMSQLPTMMKQKDYDGCVDLLSKAAKHYQHIDADAVDRSADELTQILRHEDIGRRLQTNHPVGTVREWAIGEATHTIEQARFYYSSQNHSKALCLAREARASFAWAAAAEESMAAALVEDIEAEMNEAAARRKKQDEEDAKKPNADEVNHKFKSFVMYNAGTLRDLFHEMDDDSRSARDAASAAPLAGCDHDA